MKREISLRKAALWAGACALVFGCVVGCSPSPGTGQATPSEVEAGVEQTEAVGVLDAKFDAMAALAEEYAPSIITYPNGVQVQRVPQMQWTWGQSAIDDSAYNTNFLKAEQRGCRSCHADGLEVALANMTYRHVEVMNDLGTELTVSDCKICHAGGDGYVPDPTQFGNLIHGIHSGDGFEGDCWTCHAATSDGNGMELWDEVKWDVYQGVTLIPDVQGDFSFNQDVTNSMFSMTWMSAAAGNRENLARELDGEPLDEATFNNWKVSVTGLVDNPIEMTLSELIAQAPTEKRILTNECIENPIGGELISNVEITGVPVSWLLDKAGVKDGATGLYAIAPDEWKRAIAMDSIMASDSYLVYEINGERLPWDQGYPLAIWTPGIAAPANIRWVTELNVVDEPVDEMKIFECGLNADGTVYNKPNAGITHFLEGQIIKVGEPYIFEGYAYSFGEQIAAIEFSMDRGETWTRFETPDTDPDKWVYWNFAYTPEAVDANVLSVRAVTSDGTVCYRPDEILFNAKE